jgi:ribonucleoside-diphosphate reductase alpha chain
LVEEKTSPVVTPNVRPLTTIKQIRKRDGRLVTFDQNKITSALSRAIAQTIGKDAALAQRLSDQVVKILEEKFDGRTVPTVEEAQDIVEKVLLDNGQAKTAKSYILYRQKRAEIRKEKQRILEKDEIDEVDKRFDLNALRVLKARYLRKDIDGKLIETPKQLFARVAVHTCLPSLLYDERIYDRSGKTPEHPAEDFDPAANDGKLSMGKYALSRFHLEALKRMYDRFNSEGRARLRWSEFLAVLREGKLNNHEAEVTAFYDLMVSKRFMPNTPALANFGNVLGMGSACFVLDIEDSIESIMDGLKKTAIVFKAGGGMGYNFSKLRPEGDFVSSTSGIASGPISFMTLFDTMTEVIKQGGIRRGANMGILNSNHPDIEKFITAKKGNRALRNFNVSVLIMPDFWDYYEKDKPYPLVNPRTIEVVRTTNARRLFDMIVFQAWESAEPGVIFYDHVNKYNPFLKSLGPIVTTNPCGEVLLYPNESCNLGSINVWGFVKEEEEGRVQFDWDALGQTVRLATRFLDNVIDVNRFPLKEIEEMTLATRKIGLGVMGLGDLLYELKIPYNTEDARKFMEQLMEFINYHSKLASVELAKERGSFPYYDRSFYPEGRLPFSGFDQKSNWRLPWDKVAQEVKRSGLRNSYTTVVAPTGSISMIAGCSSGIEPVYSLVYEKNVKVGSFYYVDPVFETVMTSQGLYDEELIREVSDRGGTVQGIQYIPTDIKHVFVTAMDITPEAHIRALAAFQKWVDSSISKTNNFPAEATVDDMRESYLLAYKLGCKDVTVFRDTSIKGQVLVAPGKAERRETSENTGTRPGGTQPYSTRTRQRMQVLAVGAPISSPDSENYYLGRTQNGGRTDVCPQCYSFVVFQEGCYICPECGWGACS